MKNTPLTHWIARGLLAVGAAAATSAHAYPDKVITVIVPFGAGTINDINARDFAQVLSVIAKQPVVVENRTGAEGTIGGQALLSAPADGHTLMFASNSLTVFDPLMKKSIPYDPVKDIIPVCGAGRTTLLLNASGASPYRTVGDIVAAAKAQPGKLTFAYSSTSTRLSGELLQQAAGIRLTGVPYRASVAALTEISGGQVDLMFIDRVSAAPFYESGKVRPVATSGEQRLKALPQVATFAEAGLPGVSVQPWFGLYASGKSTPAVLRQVSELVGKAVRSPEMAVNAEKRGLEAFTLCGDALVKHRAEEMELWRGVIKKAGIEPQ
ncbi:MAG TPA: tripartite tricarboxylate transporter substrate binding protein [Ramlibacter sp.]|nr:tripartite tricarboxylate transporter substrate binding protein [Ramlibacter sp.]